MCIHNLYVYTGLSAVDKFARCLIFGCARLYRKRERRALFAVVVIVAGERDGNKIVLFIITLVVATRHCCG